MLTIVRNRVYPALWPAFIGLLLSLGLLLPVVHALFMDAIGTAVLWCIVTALFCVIAGFGGRVKQVALGCGALLLVLLMLQSGLISRLGGMAGAVFQLLRGDSGPLTGYAKEAAAAAGILLTIAGWGMTKQSAGLYPALSITMVSILLVWFSGHREGLYLFAPALVSVCVLFARSIHEDAPLIRITILSAVIVLLALGAAQIFSVNSQKMETFAEQLRNYITDTLFFTEPRTVYTLQADGYMPLETRLGGPVKQQERPVMVVETPKSILLKGSIHNDYNGLSWSDTLSTRRYLYTDPRHRGTRADIMDENRPLPALRSDSLFETIDIKISMRSGSASTLFVPLRAENLSMPIDMVPYFNASSEIFVTRDLMAGDEYTLSASVINPSDTRLPRLLEEASARGESRNMEDYLRLPQAVAEEVAILTNSIIAGAATPLEKALSIQTYLRSSFRYTLTPQMPPSNQDFVSYFLLRGKEGYCTYFASAMAVMGRLAGLPTRYVEGYLADPSGGIALVSSKHAHAWTEIYFDGFGWISFDATPPQGTGGSSGNNNGQQGANQEQESGQEEADSGEQAGDGPTEQPEPTPVPDGQEGGQDDPQDGTTGNEQDDPMPDDASATPEPSSEPSPANTPERESDKRWMIWLFLLLLSAALIARAIWTRPEMVLRRQCKADDDRLLMWYRSLLGLLASSGMSAKPHESPVAYGLRIEQALPESCQFLSVADAVTHLGYGRFGTGPAQVGEAWACYEVLYKNSSIRAKCVWLFRRMLRGIGSVKQVP